MKGIAKYKTSNEHFFKLRKRKQSKWKKLTAPSEKRTQRKLTFSMYMCFVSLHSQHTRGGSWGKKGHHTFEHAKQNKNKQKIVYWKKKKKKPKRQHMICIKLNCLAVCTTGPPRAPLSQCASQSLSVAVCIYALKVKLHALVYDTLPPTTATTS